MKMPFGKYKGTYLNKLPYNYLRWLKFKANIYGQLKIELEKMSISKIAKYSDYSTSYCGTRNPTLKQLEYIDYMRSCGKFKGSAGQTFNSFNNTISKLKGK